VCTEHNIVLDPTLFLTRCVKCNGSIAETAADDPRLQGHDIPDSFQIFICEACEQPYWWNEREKSSSVRAKSLAERLFEYVLQHTNKGDDGEEKALESV
jgi:hypothetical protein